MATEVFNFLTTGAVPYTVHFLTINTSDGNGWAMSQPSVYNTNNEMVGFTISARTGTGFTITTDADARVEFIASLLTPEGATYPEVEGYPDPEVNNRSGYVKIPKLNPIEFFAELTGDFFYNQQKEWTSRKGYKQKYCWGDVPGLQFIAPFSERQGGARIELLDADQVSLKTWFLTLTDNAYDASVYRWMNGFPSTGYTDGVYFLRLSLPGAGGVTIKFMSEPILLKTSHEETLKITYTHDQNDFDCVFVGETDYPPFMMRVSGGVKNDGFTPGGNYTMFQDMDLSPVLLNATPQDVYRFTFGDNHGIPNYLAGKLNRLFSLAYVSIDGVYYNRKEGATLEASQRDSIYPLNFWTLDLIESENLFSLETNGAYPNQTALDWSVSAITFDNTNITFDLLTY